MYMKCFFIFFRDTESCPHLTLLMKAKPFSMKLADDWIENAQYVHMNVVLDCDFSMRLVFMVSR